MIEIHRAIFCEEVSEGQFGKLNLMGYIPSKKISVDRVPYLFRSTLLLEGNISKGEQAVGLTITLVFRNQQGADVERIAGKPMIIQVDPDKDQTLTILAPFDRLIIEYGFLDVLVHTDSQVVLSETYEIVQGEAPNVRLTDRTAASSVLQDEGRQILLSVVGSASRQLDLVDQYLYPETLIEILKVLPSEAEVRVLTSPKRENAYSIELVKIKSLHGSVEVKFSIAFHDRYIVVNETEYYHFGHSFKDLGRGRVSQINKVFDKRAIEELKQKFTQAWSNARRLG